MDIHFDSQNYFSLTQLQTLSVLECVLGVSVSSAPQFIFMGSQFFSSDSVHSGRVCVGDGVMLRLSHEGTAGVHELWRLVDNHRECFGRLAIIEFVQRVQEQPWSGQQAD